MVATLTRNSQTTLIKRYKYVQRKRKFFCSLCIFYGFGERPYINGQWDGPSGQVDCTIRLMF